MIRQLNLRILKEKMARWPPADTTGLWFLRGGVWDQLALSSSAETKTQRDSSQQVPPHHSTQLTTLWRIPTPDPHISPTFSLSAVSSLPTATSPLSTLIDCYLPIFPEP